MGGYNFMGGGGGGGYNRKYPFIRSQNVKTLPFQQQKATTQYHNIKHALSLWVGVSFFLGTEGEREGEVGVGVEFDQDLFFSKL